MNQYRSRWVTVRGPLLRGGQLSTPVFIRGGQLSAFGGHLAGGQLSGGQLSALPLVGICPVGNCPRFVFVIALKGRGKIRGMQILFVQVYTVTL